MVEGPQVVLWGPGKLKSSWSHSGRLELTTCHHHLMNPLQQKEYPFNTICIVLSATHKINYAHNNYVYHVLSKLLCDITHLVLRNCEKGHV